VSDAPLERRGEVSDDRPRLPRGECLVRSVASADALVQVGTHAGSRTDGRVPDAAAWHRTLHDTLRERLLDSISVDGHIP
jgi:hypothetical protein